MDKAFNNIVLIGMPGSGKSTVGCDLAKQLGMEFTDTDQLIEAQEHRTLQQIVDAKDYQYLREIEEKILLQINLSNAVIATGGSAVYSKEGMQHLQAGNAVVFLNISLATMLKRLNNSNRPVEKRGLAKSASQTIEAMYQERLSIYHKIAGLIINCDKLDALETCTEIIRSLFTK